MRRSVAALMLALGCCAGSTPRVEPPEIVAPRDWGSTPGPIPDARRHVLRRITVHHAGVAWRATDEGARKIKALQAWGQRDKDWPDVPYHYLIAPDGRIFAGRDPRFEGETNTEYDVGGHLLVQLWGNFEVQRVRVEQLRAAVDLIAWLCQEHGLEPASIAGHRDWSRRTTCPGLDLYRYLENGDLRSWVEQRLAGIEPAVALLPPLRAGPAELVPIRR